MAVMVTIGFEADVNLDLKIYKSLKSQIQISEREIWEWEHGMCYLELRNGTNVWVNKENPFI